jgi:hypothetical protein
VDRADRDTRKYKEGELLEMVRPERIEMGNTAYAGSLENLKSLPEGNNSL